MTTPTSTIEVPGDPSRDKDQHGSKHAAKILDNDNDFLVSEKIRRQDAATKLNSLHTNRRRHARTGDDALATEKAPGTPIGPPGGVALQPLFLDDVFDTSDQDNSPKMGPVDSMHREKRASRQILEDLLNCEEYPVRGRSHRSRPGNVEGHLGNYGGDRTYKGMSTHNLDSEHLRSLSAFSFVPGDDTFPLLADGSAGSANMRWPTNCEDDNDIERQQGRQESKKDAINQAECDPVDSMIAVPVLQENRLPESNEGVTTHGPSTSSSETTIRAVGGTTGPAIDTGYRNPQSSMRMVPSASPDEVSRGSPSQLGF